MRVTLPKDILFIHRRHPHRPRQIVVTIIFTVAVTKLKNRWFFRPVKSSSVLNLTLSASCLITRLHRFHTRVIFYHC